MWSFLRKRALIIILISIILLVSLIGFSIRDRDDVSLPEELLKDTIGAIQSIFQVPIDFVGGIFEDVSELTNTFEENQVLKSRLSEYKDLLYDVKALEKENTELRALLEKKDSDILESYNLIDATVNARSPEPMWMQQLSINKGKQHGVRANMAVITANGMIGKVKTAYQFTSDVQLLSGFDRNNRISALVQSNGEKEKQQDVFGLIEGYDEEKEALILTIQSTDKKISKGQLVVSSGMGGVFPRGLIIGEIESVEMDSYGLTKVAYVKSAADLYDINHVMVVDRNMNSPESDQSEEEES
ncbi:rod shape-determining protein MreC [Virgibacillus sp. MSP4-1]|uniref:rod shape-determining protein MreC n=1 Tax=Virgibacillus sp. MSP4-1 TaxID=2700081 RepID=UPI00039E9A75|nr:rod shape-determining protein MreC [Virgibacillus sp. MSP4-1]QHS22909.1 rod shape-determining protein MreC [Virgibacillus sp. MSP4-1]